MNRKLLAYMAITAVFTLATLVALPIFLGNEIRIVMLLMALGMHVEIAKTKADIMSAEDTFMIYMHPRHLTVYSKVIAAITAVICFGFVYFVVLGLQHKPASGLNALFFYALLYLWSLWLFWILGTLFSRTAKKSI